MTRWSTVELRTASVATSGIWWISIGSPARHPAVVLPVLLQRFLPALAEETGGSTWRPNAAIGCATYLSDPHRVSQPLLVTYTPAGVEAGGWHPIQVKLKNKRGNVTARRGYLR